MCYTGAARTLGLLSEEGEGHKEKRLKTNEMMNSQEKLYSEAVWQAF